MTLDRRLKRLESQRLDSTGLVTYSDAWYAFHERNFGRLEAEEDIGDARISLLVRYLDVLYL